MDGILHYPLRRRYEAPASIILHPVPEHSRDSSPSHMRQLLYHLDTVQHVIRSGIFKTYTYNHILTISYLSQTYGNGRCLTYWQESWSLVGYLVTTKQNGARYGADSHSHRKEVFLFLTIWCPLRILPIQSSTATFRRCRASSKRHSPTYHSSHCYETTWAGSDSPFPPRRF